MPIFKPVQFKHDLKQTYGHVWYLNILPFYSQYILSIAMFVVKNMDTFTLNSDIQSIHTRQGSDLRYPTYKLTKVQKGVYCSGIKIYNNLPQNLKNMTNDVNKFKLL
jgi:hypothetical protein